MKKNEYEVIMIGNTAVGKTSMLSAMANELDEYNTNELQLNPTTHEFKILQEQWNEMMELVENQEAFSTLETGIEGAAVDFVEHMFDFKVEGKRKATVIFTDTKGAMTGELDERLKTRVNNAFGVYCVIDASVLMECNASKNNRVNCPKFVKKLLNDVYNDGDGNQPTFVVFVLTKCEKYLATKKGQKELLDAFHDQYGNIVDLLRKAPVPPNLHVIAIQTMGCVEFFKLDDNGLPEFRVIPNQEFKSKDCAYPLVVLMHNLIDALEAKAGLWQRFKELVGWETALREYASKLDQDVNDPVLYKPL